MTRRWRERFEPSVPPPSGRRRFRVSPIGLCGTSRSAGKTGPFWDRDRRFESRSLHIESATKLVRTGPTQTRDCVLRYLQALGYP